jgi:hypothetical protein
MLRLPWFLLILATVSPGAAQSSPEANAVRYLAQEVPRWSKENGCFSCHNNGDGARALYTAVRLGYEVPQAALADSSEWLKQPSKWDSNRGNPAFSDKKLARIQFAAALSIMAPAALGEAAASLLPYQETDGSWQVDTGTALGSPVTYGAALATTMARMTLDTAHEPRFAPAIALADKWLTSRKPMNVMEAAALLLGAPAREDCSKLLLAAQNSDGGWGPQPHAPTEVFDTALALLALVRLGAGGDAIARGRDYLIRAQLPAGGWVETTRPSGANSYAQHISTCGWATLALLATHPKR